MNADGLRGLRLIAYGSMLACSAVAVGLSLLTDIDLLQNVIFRETLISTVLFFALFRLAVFAHPRVRPHISIPWLRRALDLLPPALELTVFYFWIPGAVTIADYLVLPHSLGLADPWLAASEAWIGLPHWRTYPWFQNAGLIPVMTAIYNSIELQINLMFVYWLVYRQDLTRLYEYSALIAFLGFLSVGFLWAMPAEGPWAWYQGRYPTEIGMPSYLPALRGLREHTFVDLDQVYGFLNFPSFHTVFALLIAHAMRGTRWFLPLAIWNALVIIATVPIGWHYLLDIVGGVAFVAFGLWFVGAFSRRVASKPGSAAVQTATGG